MLTSIPNKVIGEVDGRSQTNWKTPKTTRAIIIAADMCKKLSSGWMCDLCDL